MELQMEFGESFWEGILKWDQRLFLTLNGAHTPWLDPVMGLLSSYWGWGTVCAVVLVWVAFGARLRCSSVASEGGSVPAGAGFWGNVRGQRLGAALFLLGSLGVNSLLTNLVKVLVARPRPIHDTVLAPLVHALEKYEASYSFFSAHASNSFCLAVFVLLSVRNRLYGCLLLGWAAAVSYSRIYVGKHYPLDVLCGLLFGSLMGWFGYRLYCRFILRSCAGWRL